jgi:hypothetical protein
MFDNSCTTVERVEKLSDVVAYSLLVFNAMAEEALGRVRGVESRGAIVRAFLATARAEDRMASIVDDYVGVEIVL